jgi:hypothetical protein
LTIENHFTGVHLRLRDYPRLQAHYCFLSISESRCSSCDVLFSG